MESAYALPIPETGTNRFSQNFLTEARKSVGIGIIAMSIPRIIMP